jgi:MoxR-like ATPase
VIEKNNLDKARTLAERLINNLELVIFGKHQVLEYLIIALLSEGHVLIEDVPGVGKTMLAKALAKSSGCKFSRIQFTPDLLPSDITGVSIYDTQKKTFEFRPGPVFTQVLLADEINRATPKSQSALLEAMGENQVSAENVTRVLPRPFFVLATQNPMEFEGVFPLPESQMDRFLIRISIGYPTKEIESSILDRMQVTHPIDSIKEITTPEEIYKIQSEIRNVFVSKPVRSYLLDIIQATRKHPDILLGSSPRASLGLLRASQSRAVLQGRDFIMPEDVKATANVVLSHRLILNPDARLNNLSQVSVMSEILDTISPPLMDENPRS